MCAIFGLLDYKSSLTSSQRLKIIKALGTAAEVRGTDATGIAFFQRGRLCIQKAAKPAHKMKYRIPSEVKVIMGHTRMTTQGSADRNQNNHPFPGEASGRSFALAHNGVLCNDRDLRRERHFPKTDIETDSYIAVQLIEQKKELTFDGLREMAEAVEGSFVFTILDQDNSLYFVKGENPLTIYHYPDLGLYLYASTPGILDRAFAVLGMDQKYDTIWPEQGEILRIDNQGQRAAATFDTSKIDWGWPFAVQPSFARYSDAQTDYIQSLRSIAEFYGYDGGYIDALLEGGCTSDEIEELIYCGKTAIWEE